MRLTEENKAALRVLLDLPNLPDDVAFQIDVDAEMAFQAYDQDTVKRVRAAFPGAFWKKTYVECGCNWWEYTTTYNGLKVKIYACREAPPTCVAIEETIRVKRQVPIAYEEREVEEKRLRWDCSSEVDRVRAMDEADDVLL